MLLPLRALCPSAYAGEVRTRDTAARRCELIGSARHLVTGIAMAPLAIRMCAHFYLRMKLRLLLHLATASAASCNEIGFCKARLSLAIQATRSPVRLHRVYG